MTEEGIEKMTIHKGHWPEPAAGLVAVAREYPDAGSARAAFEARANGAEGLVSFTAYEGIDHDGAFTYEQWTGEDAIQDLDGAPVFRLYRGQRGEGVPGCLVIVSVEFEGPDERRQRDWIDLVFEAPASEPARPEGGIGGHFHVSTDGTRVLNYAEWTSAAAHRAALAAPGADGIGTTDTWKKVRTYPGMSGGSVKRYRPVVSAVAA
ncbi:antibiotic biosynthesis monooxygenase [Amycolatopsis sp. QT-25]|uniref:antibiotic biosynthesis monooxygenase n=1 Tax=Amycolatopsis sp. QT-25 TaxID=3034022 RepID=UPI0023EB6F8E|nr:antibiotic biosynthesis monooxygenase [Amycolatopsis sp. QT-25]WET78728.1 antibiotic biosynthesis monooxygenase [Amycolatopsis sp. QT-25]